MALFSLTWTACTVIAIIMSTAMARTNCNLDSPSTWVQQLSSSELPAPWDAFESLFAEGDLSISALRKAFSDRRTFRGMCGRRMRQSTAITIPEDEIITAKLERIEVREAALYLIIAIHERNLFFAYSCKLSGDTKSIGRVFSSLQTMTNPELRDRVWDVLEENSVSFASRREEAPLK